MDRCRGRVQQGRAAFVPNEPGVFRRDRFLFPVKKAGPSPARRSRRERRGVIIPTAMKNSPPRGVERGIPVCLLPLFPDS